jgi:hypothetical protein
MAIAGDYIVVKMDDSGGTLRTFAGTDIISVTPPFAYDQIDVTAVGSEVGASINGLISAPVTITGYFTTTAATGTHTVINGSYAGNKQVTFRCAVGNNAAPQVGVDPEFSGEYLVDSYSVSVENGRSLTFTATLKPTSSTAPGWATMA